MTLNHTIKDDIDQFYSKNYPETFNKDLKKGTPSHYSELYSKARSHGKTLLQVYFLEKNTQNALAEGKFHKAATLLSVALAIAKNEQYPEKHTRSLLAQLEQIEMTFLATIGQESRKKDHGRIERYQEDLPSIRENATKELDSDPMETVLANVSKSFQSLLVRIINHSIAILSDPPVKRYAIVAFGEMARDEMLPYSNISIAILAKKIDQKTLIYFENLSELIQLKIINMGETPLKAFKLDQSPVPKGFCLNPVATPSDDQILIGTPEELASWLTVEKLNSHRSLIELMATSKQILGDEGLFQAWTTRVDRIMQHPSGDNREFCEIFGRVLMMKSAEDFSIDLGALPSANPVSKIYPFFRTQLSALRIYFNLKSKSHFEILDELVLRGILTAQAVKDLRSAFAISLRHKVKQQLKLVVSEKDMIEALKTAIPFHRAIETALMDPQISFQQARFYSEGYEVLGEIELRFGKVEQAKQLFKKAVDENPNNVWASTWLGKIQYTLPSHSQDSDEEKNHADEAVRMSKKRHGKKGHPELGLAFTELGITQFKRKEFSLSLDSFTKSLNIYEKLYKNEARRDVATTLYNIGSAHYHLMDYKNAYSFYKRALHMREQLNRPEEVALSWKSLALTEQKLGEIHNSLHSLKKMLEIYSGIYGIKSLEVARAMNDVAKAHRLCGDRERAETMHREALEIFYLLKPQPHKDIGWCLGSLGVTLNSLGKTEEAIQAWLDAEKEYKMILTANLQPSLDKIYTHLAEAFQLIGQKHEADKYRELIK